MTAENIYQACPRYETASFCLQRSIPTWTQRPKRKRAISLILISQKKDRAGLLNRPFRRADQVLRIHSRKGTGLYASPSEAYSPVPFHQSLCRDFQSHNYTPYLAVETFTLGPMVVVSTQERMYWPLAAAGFAFTIAPIRAS